MWRRARRTATVWFVVRVATGVMRHRARVARPSGGNLTRQTVIWLSPILVTLHNVEEAFTFDRALRQLPALLPAGLVPVATRLTYPTMLVALAVVTVLAVGVALLASRTRSPSGLWLMLVLQATMALNALSHLVVALILFRGYAPGLVTALVVNVPFAAYCLRRAWRERWVSRGAFRAVFPAALLVHGPLLAGALWAASTLGD